LGALVLVGALLLYFVSIWPLGMGYPKSLSLVLAIGGVVFWLCGWQVLKICAFPIAYLLLAMPLPEGIYVQLTMPLRMFATKVTTVLLQVAVPGLDVTPSGTVIDFLYMGEPGRLNVAEACSGMRSLIGLSALGVAIAFLTPRPAYQRLILLVACIPIGVFCNIIRVFITSLLQVFGQDELSRGTAHSLLGLVTFILALSLFSLLGYVMSNLFLDEPEDGAKDDPESAL
jgi:exosortase